MPQQVHPRRPAAWVFALLLALLPAWRAGAEEPKPRTVLAVEILRLGPGAALLSLPSHRAADGPLPVVLLLSDGEGPGPRSAAYGERLLENGMALLEPDFAGSLPAEAVPPSPATQFGLALQAIAADPRLDPRRVTVLGLGQGARMALLGLAAGVPAGAVALLYPGCDAALAEAARRVPGTARVLLLHGDADAANRPAECAALARAFPVPGAMTHRVLAGADYGWDAYSLVHPGGAVWLPHPAGGGRTLSRPDPVLTEMAADRVLAFLLAAR